MTVPVTNSTRWFLTIFIALFLGKVLAEGGLKTGMVLAVVPPLVLLIVVTFKRPELLLYASVLMAFAVSLLGRYVPGIPFGLSVDAILMLLILVLVFDPEVGYRKDHLSNPLVKVLFIWMLFSFIEVGNPLAKSKVAWFYANRGLSFYPFLLTVLTLYVCRKHKHLQVFLMLWAVMSGIGTLWGIKQLFVGLSATEQLWLDAGAGSTHVLFGKLRVFSYYSDAAQFGASQAHTAVVFGIMGLCPGKMRWRGVYLFVCVLSIYGMLISGTRGALPVLVIGGFTYLVMTKNFRIVMAGLLMGVFFLFFLKYTTIGQSNYQINRLRTSLDPNDPSFRIRKEREKVLSTYLKDKPLGGGIGSAGYWGKRFSPGTFLAELGTDGHYTRVWMETGIIGLYLHFGMLLTMVIYLGRLLWKMGKSRTLYILISFFSGFTGVAVGSYSNGYFTQFPIGPLMFIGLGMIHLGGTGQLEMGKEPEKTEKNPREKEEKQIVGI